MLTVNNINKTYLKDGKTKIFDDLSFAVKKGEFVAIFGPNGCGKTTLLNAIAGLTEFDSGSITYGDKNIRHLKVGFVFQDYKDSLFPWLKARDNITFPLRIKNMPKNKADSLVNKIYDKYDFNFRMEAYPYELSAGQQQLVAFLRGLIINPDLFLLDEPFSSLDYQTTLLLLEKLSYIWNKLKITTLFVSHEIDDAIFLSQKIILLSNKPTRVIKTFEVSKSYPRKLSFIGSNEFNNLKSNILTLYRKEIGIN